MTTDITELRKIVAEMTPGEWGSGRAAHPGDKDMHYVRAERRDGDGRRATSYPAICKSSDQNNEANARAIVAAVRLLRAVVEPDDAVVERVARALYRAGLTEAKRILRSVSRTDRQYEDMEWREYATQARVVLATIAALAVEG